MTSLGFTGSRHGMTDSQKVNFVYLLGRIQPTEFHVGDCVGADEEAFNLVREFRPECKIIGHIPSDDKLRAFCEYDEEWSPKPYLDRNVDIVDCSDVVTAAPRKSSRGTKYTMQYCKKSNTELLVL